MQFILGGLTSGAIYALIALGFCVVHNTMGIVNFVQVDFVSLGGMLFYTCVVMYGLPIYVGVVGAIIGVAIIAALIELLALRPSKSDHHLVLIFLTIGVSIIMRGIMKLIWGENRMAVPSLSGDDPIHVFGATIMPQAIWILALTSLAIIFLIALFRYTGIGLAMRGVAANSRAALIIGLNTGRVKSASFALAGALGGLAGILVTPLTTLNYDVGVLLGLKGFAGAILGGFGSFGGAVIGGLALGLMESLTAGYFSSAYKDVVAFVMLLLVLFVRPKGIMGR
ncbi:MAG: branched-chain amino acid ABC transporter permease [Thermodesulfobacteriota bacterium]